MNEYAMHSFFIFHKVDGYWLYAHAVHDDWSCAVCG